MHHALQFKILQVEKKTFLNILNCLVYLLLQKMSVSAPKLKQCDLTRTHWNQNIIFLSNAFRNVNNWYELKTHHASVNNDGNNLIHSHFIPWSSEIRNNYNTRRVNFETVSKYIYMYIYTIVPVSLVWKSHVPRLSSLQSCKTQDSRSCLINFWKCRENFTTL